MCCHTHGMPNKASSMNRLRREGKLASTTVDCHKANNYTEDPEDVVTHMGCIEDSQRAR